jgi:hypothetical protein
LVVGKQLTGEVRGIEEVLLVLELDVALACICIQVDTSNMIALHFNRSRATSMERSICTLPVSSDFALVLLGFLFFFTGDIANLVFLASLDTCFMIAESST